jgi:hypothetical protein
MESVLGATRLFGPAGAVWDGRWFVEESERAGHLCALRADSCGAFIVGGMPRWLAERLDAARGAEEEEAVLDADAIRFIASMVQDADGVWWVPVEELLELCVRRVHAADARKPVSAAVDVAAFMRAAHERVVAFLVACICVLRESRAASVPGAAAMRPMELFVRACRRVSEAGVTACVSVDTFERLLGVAATTARVHVSQCHPHYYNPRRPGQHRGGYPSHGFMSLERFIAFVGWCKARNPAVQSGIGEALNALQMYISRPM